MKFKKLVKASENWELLRDKIYNALADTDWNNGNIVSFSKEDVQKAFDWCLEKYFTDNN